MKILLVLTAANQIQLQGGRSHKTGFFLGELFEPLEVLLKEGHQFDIATPDGARPPLDEDSKRWIYWALKGGMKERALRLLETDDRFLNPLKLEDLSDEELSKYSGLFVPGGHGPMVDLAVSSDFARVLRHFHKMGKPTALICHAPAALASVADSKGWPYRGYRMTVFSDLEERFAQTFFLKGKLVEFPGKKLRDLGAEVETACLPFTSKVVRDRELITGQNPYSPRKFGEEFASAITEYSDRGSLL